MKDYKEKGAILKKKNSAGIFCEEMQDEKHLTPKP